MCRLVVVGPLLTSQSSTDNYCSAITDGRFDEPHARDVLLFCLRNVRCNSCFSLVLRGCPYPQGKAHFRGEHTATGSDMPTSRYTQCDSLGGGGSTGDAASLSPLPWQFVGVYGRSLRSRGIYVQSIGPELRMLLTLCT